MKKILVVCDFDPRCTFNYTCNYYDAMCYLGGNSGNLIFQNAIYKIFSSIKDVSCDVDTKQFKTYSFLNRLPNATVNDQWYDEVNSKYDFIVWSPANILALYAKDVLKEYSDRINRIKVPILILGLGAQFTSNIAELAPVYKNIQLFINSILKNQKSVITFRGFLTLELVNKLGFNFSDDSVIGCPSLYVKGRKLIIRKKELKKDSGIIFNGFRLFNDHKLLNNLMNKYENSVFVDQEEFYRLLYLPHKLTSKERYYLGFEDLNIVDLIEKDKIKLYCNVDQWANLYRTKSVVFSYGCRVHGNFISILEGIPCAIDCFDSRTYELADYFNIPKVRINDVDNLDKIYHQVTFEKFNNEFASKYDNFKRKIEYVYR